MTWKTKLLTGVGALVVVGSTMGTMAFADAIPGAQPTANQTSTVQQGTYKTYKAALQTERATVKQLRDELKQVDGQMHSLMQSFKGHHVFHGHAGLKQQVQSLHKQVKSEQTQVKADFHTLRADRVAKDWSAVQIDMNKLTTDLQSLLQAKQSLYATLQSVSSDPSTANSGTTGA